MTVDYTGGDWWTLISSTQLTVNSQTRTECALGAEKMREARAVLGLNIFGGGELGPSLSLTSPPFLSSSFPCPFPSRPSSPALPLEVDPLIYS